MTVLHRYTYDRIVAEVSVARLLALRHVCFIFQPYFADNTTNFFLNANSHPVRHHL
jgi:hypothetical protein